MMEIILLIIFSVLFFGLAWRKTEVALAAVIIFLPSYLVRFKIFAIPATLLEIMILLLFVAWLFKKIITGQPAKTQFSKFHFLALLFLLSAIFSVFISPDLKSALGIFKAYFLEPLLFFFVFINTVSSPRQLKLMFWATGVSALFVSLVALWQYLEILPSFEPWISQIPKRVTSVFDYPNAVGLYLAPILVLFSGILLLSQTGKNLLNKRLEHSAKWFIWGVILFSLLGIIFSFSRGAFLGILAGLIFFSFFSRFKKQIWISLIILLLIVFAIPQTRELVLSVLTIKDVSTDVRAVLWQGTWNLLKERPLEGAGLAGFPIIYNQYRLIKHIELPLYPHNVIFNFWTELGLAGLIIFLWLVVKFFQTGIKLRNIHFDFSPLPVFNFPIVLLGVMVAILVYGVVDVPYFKNDLAVFFWFLIALMVTVDQFSLPKEIKKDSSL